MDTFKSCCTFVACPVIDTHARINFMFVLFQDEDAVNYPLDSKLYTRLKRGYIYRASRALPGKTGEERAESTTGLVHQRCSYAAEKIRSNP